MARIALGLLSVALLLGTSGCTWTQTRRDYPPDVRTYHPQGQPQPSVPMQPMVQPQPPVTMQ